MTELFWVLVGIIGFAIGWYILFRHIDWDAIKEDIEKGEIL